MSQPNSFNPELVDSPDLAMVSSYVADILERAHAVELLAENLAASDDYVSPEAPQLIRGLAAIVVELRAAVVAQWKVYQVTKHSRDLTLLRAMDETLRNLAGELRLPARAVSDRVPGVLTRLVAKKARELLPNAGVILRPQWTYNYKIHRNDIHTHYHEVFKGAFDSQEVVSRCFRGLKAPLYIISFPFIERSSVHLHSVLGHELGHLMAKGYVPSPESEDSFFQEIRRRWHLQNSAAGEKKGRRVSPQLTIGEDADLNRAVAARHKALKEFAADAASVFLFGIAALFGAGQVAMSRALRGRREAEDRFYPNWGSRLSHMFDLAERENWFSLEFEGTATPEFKDATCAVAERIESLKRWVKRQDNWSVQDPWIAAGHESARELLPHIHDYLRGVFAGAFASRDQTYLRLPVLFERLRQLLPPDNVGDSETKIAAPYLEDVFVVSWWYRLWRVKPKFTKNDLAEEPLKEADRLRRLTLKAIENIDLVDRFGGKLAELE